MFSFTEEKQQQAPFRSIAGEGRSREALGVVSSENRKLRLALGFPSNTLTHTRRERERDCASRKQELGGKTHAEGF